MKKHASFQIPFIMLKR